MRPLLTIYSFSGQDEMLDRHWPGYETSGCDLLIASPTDATCRRGGLAYGRSERFGGQLMRRTFYAMEHVLRLGYDTYYFVEGDSIVTGKAPTKLDGGLHCFLWQHDGSPRFRAKQYPHWCWGMNRNTLTKLVLMARQYDPAAEEGFPDRLVGLICEETGIPMIHRPDLCYSRNRLDRPEYVEQARAAIASGAVFVHGLKTQSDLDALNP